MRRASDAAGARGAYDERGDNNLTTVAVDGLVTLRQFPHPMHGASAHAFAFHLLIAKKTRGEGFRQDNEVRLRGPRFNHGRQQVAVFPWYAPGQV